MPGAPGMAISPVPFVVIGPSAMAPMKYAISGVTRDSAGAVLGGCVVDIFDTATDTKQSGVTSNPVDGRYEAEVTGAPGMTFYAVAYKPGAPDVAGTTVNTLVAVLV